MSARVCAVCRALLGKEHLVVCTVAKPGSTVIDAQCIDTTRETAILWVMLRLHQLQAAGLIVPADPDQNVLAMTPKGVLHALDYFSRNLPPHRESIIATCQWLFTTRMPTPQDTIPGLITLVLDAKP